MNGSARAGRLIPQQAGPEGYAAFIPAPLPPDPPLDLSAGIGGLLERASGSLGQLDGLSRSLDPDRLLYMYVRKEAVLSSQIEGTQSTLTELLEYENSEAPGVPFEDVREVSRYVSALRFAVQQLANGTPLSLRLIRDTHGVLMSGGRGGKQAPGEFRRTQTWIGGTRPGTARFVPPPPHELMRVLGELEKFICDSNATPLVKAGLAHAQFETIHPFLDGNGRLGRMLITMILCAEGAVSQPFLYLSLYFKQNRDDYYAALQRVRSDGDWEGWMAYYLEGVDWTARQTTGTTMQLLDLFRSDRERVVAAARGKAMLRVYELLQQRVIVSVRRTAEQLSISIPTATSGLKALEEMGIVREITGRTYGRLFAYDKQLEILNRTDDLSASGAEAPRSREDVRGGKTQQAVGRSAMIAQPFRNSRPGRYLAAGMTRVEPEDICAPEWVEWYRLTPAERWRQSARLWETYLALGGTLDPDSDTHSPFHDPDARRESAPDGGTGVHLLRRSGV